ncbi:MAG: sugar O-acetyltransferase [Selenomonadaceae bacterium]|nr:sugar O-acetyltransferase [Selenomonadaceae bacterium]
MNVFERLRAGEHFHVLDNEDYRREAHGEFNRCRHLCWQINSTDPDDQERIVELERELFNGRLEQGTFLTPPFQIDAACRVFLGKNVFANHGLTVMSVGTITIEDGVMLGPEVGLFTVNHEPKNIRVIMTKEIVIKKNAWIGARVNILPGVTIGENAIVGTGSIVTKDIPDNAIAVGNPARIIKTID